VLESAQAGLSWITILRKRMKQIPPHTALSDAIAKELKQRGFRFLGSTIIYSHLQAVGAVNDHLVDCFRWKAIARGRRASRRS